MRASHFPHLDGSSTGADAPWFRADRPGQPEDGSTAGASSLRRSPGWSSRCASIPRARAVLREAQARGPGWRSTSTGRFVPAGVTDELVEQRILEAYAGGRPARVVTGWAGLRLLGGGFFDGLASDGATRCRCRSRRTASGSSRALVCSRGPRPDPGRRGGAGPRHAVRDRRARALRRDPTARRNRSGDMVVAVDMAFGGELTSIRRMRRYRCDPLLVPRRPHRHDRVVAARQRAGRSASRVDVPARLGVGRRVGTTAGQPGGSRPRWRVRRHP